MNATPQQMPKAGRGNQRFQILFGLVLILVGTAFLAEKLDIHWFDEFWNWWPVILIVLGAGRVMSGRSDERTLGLILVFIGGVFFMRYTLGLDVSLGDLWPIILLIIGGSIVLRGFRGPQAPRDPNDLSSVIRESAIVGGISRKNTSQSFQGGELTAIMGGCEIDLREARMAGPQAVIDCFTMWGGIEITLPRDWIVDPQISVFAAGFEDKTTPPVQPAGRLVIRGTALMAGIEIKN